MSIITINYKVMQQQHYRVRLFKGIVHRKIKMYSVSTHHYTDGGAGEVFTPEAPEGDLINFTFVLIYNLFSYKCPLSVQLITGI